MGAGRKALLLRPLNGRGRGVTQGYRAARVAEANLDVRPDGWQVLQEVGVQRLGVRRDALLRDLGRLGQIGYVHGGLQERTVPLRGAVG